jgi:hypothetical protein
VSITYTRRAQVALASAQPRDRKKIVASLEQIAATGVGPTTRLNVLQVAGSPGLFMLRTPYDLRVIFRHSPDGSILVEDIVRHDALRRYWGVN